MTCSVNTQADCSFTLSFKHQGKGPCLVTSSLEYASLFCLLSSPIQLFAGLWQWGIFKVNRAEKQPGQISGKEREGMLSFLQFLSLPPRKALLMTVPWRNLANRHHRWEITILKLWPLCQIISWSFLNRYSLWFQSERKQSKRQEKNTWLIPFFEILFNTIFYLLIAWHINYTKSIYNKVMQMWAN